MLFDRNDLKKAGQLAAVKLLPKLVSKGLGSGEVATEVEAEVLEDPIRVAATLVLVATLLELECSSAARATTRRIGGSGGVLRSNKRMLSDDDAIGSSNDIAAATQGLHHSNKQSSARSSDWKRTFNKFGSACCRGFTACRTASAGSIIPGLFPDLRCGYAWCSTVGLLQSEKDNNVASI